MSLGSIVPAVIVAYYGGADVLHELYRRGFSPIRIELAGHDKGNQFLVHFLRDNNDPSTYVVRQCDGQGANELAEELRALGVTHIIPADEAGVALSDQLCDILGLPFNGMAGSPARRDKHLMHEKVASHGIRIPAQCTASSSEQVQNWMQANHVDFPIVIKPVDGAGSAGVSKCSNWRDVSQAFAAIGVIAAAQKTVVSMGNTVIAQEFLQGTEYVVDTVSEGGVHKLIDIWQCKKDVHNGASFVYEYFDLLESDGALQSRLFDYVCGVLDALDIKVGPGHAEVYMRPDGTPVIVEIGSRLGGPRMPFGTAPCVASGKAQTEYAVDAYLQPERFHDEWPRYQKTKQSRMVFLIHHEERLFCGLNPSVIGEIRALPSYHHEEFYVQEGDMLKATIDVRSSPGFMYLMHDDRAQIEQDYARLRELERDLYCQEPYSLANGEAYFRGLTRQDANRRLILNNVTLIDGVSSGAHSEMAIVLNGNRIEAVIPALTDDVSGISCLDLSGKTVLPGLIDTHVHTTLLDEALLETFLNYGVTTVRDVGAPLETVLSLRNRVTLDPRRILVESNAVLGPRLLVCGPLLDGPNDSFDSPELKELVRSISDASEIPQVIDPLLAANVDGIKLYFGITPDLVAKIVDYVDGRVPVVMHCGVSTAAQAAEAGVDGVEHVLLSLHHDVVGDVQFLARGNMNDPGYWDGVMQDWAQLNLSRERVRNCVAALVDHKVALASTLVLMWLAHVGLDAAEQDANKLGMEASDIMPALYDPLPYKQALEQQLAFLKLFHDAGGCIVGGTDSGANKYPQPGLGLLHELELLSGAIGTMNAIQCVTSKAAAHLRKSQDIGHVKSGCVADLLILNGNPLDDISYLYDQYAVFANGTPILMRGAGAQVPFAANRNQYALHI